MGYHVSPELLRRPGEDLTAFVNRLANGEPNEVQFLVLAEYLRTRPEYDVSMIEVTYAGSGDEGSDGTVTYFDFARRKVDGNLAIPEAIDDKLDELAWDIAYDEHPGFEINEGGHGTVQATYEQGEGWTLQVDHYDHIVTEEYKGSDVTPDNAEDV